MTDLANRTSTEITLANNAMLKQVSAHDFQELLAAYLLKCIKLNLEPLPEPESLGMIAKELFYLLQREWPGCRPKDLWKTLKYGMAKQGQYRVRINYPTVANWIMYHRHVHKESQKEEPPPNLEQQAQGVLSGLKEYRRKVEAGEYIPKGRQ